MIINIPTADELTERADALLQLSYSMVSKLYENQREEWRQDADDEQLREYWEKCAPSLANALALLQQAHELYLKGKIAAVSPYLLLAREPQHWPKKSALEDISFSEFLTVGASELPRLHDMVCTPRLDSKTQTFLNTIRERRNMFVHQGHAPTASAAELFEAALITHKWAHPDTPWFEARQAYLNDDHLSALYSSDHVMANLHGEFAELLAELKPASFKQLLGFDKKSRWFYCLNCERQMGDYGEAELTAQLGATEQESVVNCLVCGECTPVLRRKCYDPDCKSIVHAVSTERWDETCLICRTDEHFEVRKAEQESIFGSMVTWDLTPTER
ncbi:hypothetical protein GR198_29600 [Rhizobium leguminosarum]|uniref:hypothetical protein n=1 Tax=Rhizobium leguminosarum TaxID=384 RepID=UPI0013BF1033|nr:hypothetical protein [Rhizobium leguminosarum]NEH59875.1 hypothetical protein [Rhizobium leguminosarum]